MGVGSRTVRAVLTAVVLSVPGVAAWAEACRQDEVILRGDWGQARFSVELAATPAVRNRGLMHRETLAPGTGMLFIYEAPGSVSFWMKNTLIPLDIIFMDATGTVGRVHAMAKPHDTTPLFGGHDIQYVLEVNGGMAEHLGIDAGTQLRHPSIDPERAAWPC